MSENNMSKYHRIKLENNLKYTTEVLLSTWSVLNPILIHAENGFSLIEHRRNEKIPTRIITVFHTCSPYNCLYDPIFITNQYKFPIVPVRCNGCNTIVPETLIALFKLIGIE